MAKKSTYQLKQLIPEEKPETGTKYIVRKPSKGLKAVSYTHLTLPTNREV